MSGPECYAEALAPARRPRNVESQEEYEGNLREGQPRPAQVYATLALAAANIALRGWARGVVGWPARRCG